MQKPTAETVRPLLTIHKISFLLNLINFPANVYVLNVVSTEGDAMLPYFFQKGKHIIETFYLYVLQVVVCLPV